MIFNRLILAGAALVVTLAAHGQGQFFFNTRNTTAGNNVSFILVDGSRASGSDLFVEVLAGPDQFHLTGLTPLLPLNRTGVGAGYANPFGATYNAPAGSTVVAYRAYQGVNYDLAINRSDTIPVNQMLDANNQPVALSLPTDPTTPPPELLLGNKTIMVGCLDCPEPSPSWLIGALGCLGLLASGARRHPFCRRET